MKKDLKKISLLINNEPDYQIIESKLNFKDAEASSVVNKKPRYRFLAISLPISIVCTAIVVAAIIVPISLTKKSNILGLSNNPNTELNNNQLVMKPVSDEEMSFYAQNVSSGNDRWIITPNGLDYYYSKYKEDPEEMKTLAEQKEVYNLVAENRFRCYYVTKDAHEIVNQLYGAQPDDELLPWRGLTAYYQAYCEGLVNNEQIMHFELSTDIDHVDAIINDYYLLDIVRFYNDSNIEDFSFVDFVSYAIKNGQALIDRKASKDVLKYCSFSYASPNKWARKQKYGFLTYLNYRSFKITIENNIEVILYERYKYDNSKDIHYYDELEECVIKKTYLSSDKYSDYYEITFDYEKLIKLLCFENKGVVNNE